MLLFCLGQPAPSPGNRSEIVKSRRLACVIGAKAVEITGLGEHGLCVVQLAGLVIGQAQVVQNVGARFVVRKREGLLMPGDGLARTTLNAPQCVAQAGKRGYWAGTEIRLCSYALTASDHLAC